MGQGVAGPETPRFTPGAQTLRWPERGNGMPQGWPDGVHVSSSTWVCRGCREEESKLTAMDKRQRFQSQVPDPRQSKSQQ